MNVIFDFEEEKQWIDVFYRSVQQGLTKAMIFLQNETKSRTPVDTGRLKNSIDYEVEETEGSVFTNVEYAPYVEYGTKRMLSQPFMRLSLYSNKDKLQNIVAREMKINL